MPNVVFLAEIAALYLAWGDGDVTKFKRDVGSTHSARNSRGERRTGDETSLHGNTDLAGLGFLTSNGSIQDKRRDLMDERSRSLCHIVGSLAGG